MPKEPQINVAIVRYHPTVQVQIPYNFTGPATLTIAEARNLHQRLGDAIQRFDAEEAAKEKD